MSNPPIPYDRQANFTAFSTEQFPTVGQDLEAEFGKLQQVTGSTQSRLAEIQRDDGALKNQSVHPDALNQDVRAMFVADDITVRGAWAPGVDYAVKDIVRNTGGSYLAAVAHTSSADFDADFAAGKWLLLAGSGSTGPGFDGTFDVNVTIAPPSGGASLSLDAAVKANPVSIAGKKEGSPRWEMVLGNTVAETGVNAGSDFVLYRFSDSGVGSGVIAASRATGQVEFATRPSFGGNTPYDTGNFNPNAYAPLTGATFTGIVRAPYLLADLDVSITDRTLGGEKWSIYADNGNINFYHSLHGNRMTITAGAVVSAADFKANSDERLKEDIKPLRRGLDELKRMLPREYVKGGQPEIGFIAQEVQRVAPEAVGENSDGYLTLSHGQLLALVANAVLELDARLTRAGI